MCDPRICFHPLIPGRLAVPGRGEKPLPCYGSGRSVISGRKWPQHTGDHTWHVGTPGGPQRLVNILLLIHPVAKV